MLYLVPSRLSSKLSDLLFWRHKAVSTWYNKLSGLKVGEGKSYSTILMPQHTLGTIRFTHRVAFQEEEWTKEMQRRGRIYTQSGPVKGEKKKKRKSEREWRRAKGFSYLDDRRTMCTPDFQGLQFCNALQEDTAWN
jgi:hypothetical protein